MIRLRPYKESDSKEIVNWVLDEKEFTMWCANKLQYPLTCSQLNNMNTKFNSIEDTWFITAVDEIGSPVGYFMITLVDYIKNSAHIGFVIVKPELRGNGIGREMVTLAVKYAFDIIKVKRVTLNVFDNNIHAYNCYKSIGFKKESFTKNSIHFRDEVWGGYHMAISNVLIKIID